MASLDIILLFTKVPFNKTINICLIELFTNNQFNLNFKLDSFEKLLRLATNESFFIFDETFNNQLNGVAMNWFSIGLY